MSVRFALLDPNPREETIAVPCRVGYPDAEVGRLRFREIPRVEWARLAAIRAGRSAALTNLRRAAMARRKELSALHTGPEVALIEEILNEEYADALAEAEERILETAREIVSKGVVGHDEETFRVDVDPAEVEAIPDQLREALLAHGLSPEEAERALAEGVVRVRFRAATWHLRKGGEAQPGAAPEMVRYYERLAPGFLDLLVETIERFQAGNVATPAELHERARHRPTRELLAEQKEQLQKALAQIEEGLAELAAEEADAADPLRKSASPSTPES